MPLVARNENCGLCEGAQKLCDKKDSSPLHGTELRDAYVRTLVSGESMKKMVLLGSTRPVRT